jgi:phospholipid-transporting ATPase
LAVSATKEIVEDLKRHKADEETNRRQVEVLRDGHWLWLPWQQIGVGDIVRVRAGAFFPADLLLLSSR